MTLLNAEIFRMLPKFNTNGGADPMIHLKYTSPDSAMMWFVLEGQVENNEYRFWGIELGPDRWVYRYFTLHELESFEGPEGEHVLRDENFIPRPMSQVAELIEV